RVSRLYLLSFPTTTLFRSLHEKARFIYTRWFTVTTLAAFAFMTYVFIDRWGEIGRDTLLYYTFTQKGVAELIEFWVLFLIVGFLDRKSTRLNSSHRTISYA